MHSSANFFANYKLTNDNYSQFFSGAADINSASIHQLAFLLGV
jgi:hypothetical protein